VPIPKDVLEILRCIECRERLDERETVLVCRGCGVHYRVDGDIPIMLPGSAVRPGHD
jgi:uncharacterized protein YbaR (Trm112 family)